MTTEPWSLDRIITELNFADITREESKRTLHCPPQGVHRIRAAVDQLGAADILTVVANRVCPEGKILVIDERAMAAAEEEFLQSLRTAPWRFGGLA